MAASGLSQSEQAVIESQTKSRITEILASESFQMASSVVIPTEDPIPDPDPPPRPPDPDEPPPSSPENQGLNN